MRVDCFAGKTLLAMTGVFDGVLSARTIEHEAVISRTYVATRHAHKY